MKLRLWVVLGVLCATLAGCASRYRLALFLDIDNDRKRLKVDQTQYLLNARLGDPYQEQKVIAGEGTSLVLLCSARGEKIDLPASNLFGFDEYLKVRLFVELPEPVSAGTVELKGRSFAQMLGRYTRPAEEKIFLPDLGEMVIDSIAREHLYASIGGKFVNSKGEQITFDGQFRVRVRK